MRAVRVLASLLLLLSVAGTAQASAEPPPLRIIVPVAAGGTSDAMARLIAERLSVSTGRRVYVENRVGGTGRIAVHALRDSLSAADTILVAPLVVPVLAPLLFTDLSYRASDLAPVSQLGTFDYAFAVRAEDGATSLAQFIEWARKHPERANFGAQGNGSVPHFLGIELRRVAGFPMEFISFASSAQIEADLAGGHIASAWVATADVSGLHRAGRVRILATTGRSRQATLPEVPTFLELGMPALGAVGWTAMFASPRMPEAAREALATHVRTALADPAVQQALRARGVEPTGTTPAALAGIIAADHAYWGAVIRNAGFQAGKP